MDLEQFLNAINSNVSRIHEYKLGNDGSNGTCDCVGQIIGAVRLCGVKWPWIHGSNYTARNRVAVQRRVDKAGDLRVGDLVFKAKGPNEEGYALPSKYNSSGDLNDYYHIGVVTRITPLEITHCTSVSGGIKKDNTLGKWRYAGRLNLQTEEVGAAMGMLYRATIYAENGKNVNMRKSPDINASVRKSLPVGAEVEVIEESDSVWRMIRYDGVEGYVMAKFLQKKGMSSDHTVVLELDADIAKALLAALKSVVKE